MSSIRASYVSSKRPIPELVDITCDIIREVEREHQLSHREAIRFALGLMPLRVARAWANEVLLNGPKPSWSKARIIDEVSK